MSMHEIEDLVQVSIELLDRDLPPGHERIRDWFTALFGFQFDYDCSYTQHRVEEILVRRGHTLRLPITEHPDYVRRREFFDGITGFTVLREFGPDEEEFAGGLEDGYVDPPWLYCEAGTALWRRLGRAEISRVPLIEVVAAVAAAAERAGDVETIAFWWALGHEALVDGTPFDVEELAEVPGVAELRAIVERTNAHRFELPYGRRPEPEHLDVMDDELQNWWYRL